MSQFITASNLEPLFVKCSEKKIAHLADMLLAQRVFDCLWLCETYALEF